MRKDKRGQFYLLGAIVIIIVIIGFAAVSNYAKKRTTSEIYDIKEELGIESGKVLEYGTTPGNIDVTENFTEQYETYAGADKEIYFIFGNIEEGITVITYDEKESEISLVVEGKIGQQVLNPVLIKETKTPYYVEDEGVYKVDIKTDEENVYTFELNPGENFYFIISQAIGEEEFVVTS